jgi:acetoin:2,6-dichlorophenolindophenol oxidoreductase subunit beta
MYLRYALQAAAELQRDGISVEVVDLRSIADGYGHLVGVCLQDRSVAGSTGSIWAIRVGAEVLARVGAYAFESLKAPMGRVAVPFVPVPANKTLESEYLPSSAQVIIAAKQIVSPRF